VANVQQVRLTRDGRRVATLATLSPMRDPTANIIGVMDIAKDLSALKAVEEQQRLLSRAEEREAIAMDLHDNTLQALHGAVLLLSALERQPDADVQACAPRRCRCANSSSRRSGNCATACSSYATVSRHGQAWSRA
jgi:signal transduction histidine kinase